METGGVSKTSGRDKVTAYASEITGSSQFVKSQSVVASNNKVSVPCQEVSVSTDTIYNKRSSNVEEAVGA